LGQRRSDLVRVMMQTLLFDDQGDVWDAKSRSLAEALGASLSAKELAKYVVRNLGFIEAADNEGSVSLRLRPAVVSSMALGALIYWLHDRTVARVLISFLDGEWSHELVASREEAVNRLLARIKWQPTDRAGDFLSKLRPLESLSPASPLRALLNAWNECSGKYDRERLHRLLEKGLNSRFVLVETASQSPNLLVKEIGTGFNKDTVTWLSRIKGLRIEDQPDYAYGLWIANLYREASARQTPTLEDVDAVIRWPHQPRTSYRYQRLMVPLDAGGNSTMVLGATVLDTTVDLRVKPG
jgi:hypothetical protein